MARINGAGVEVSGEKLSMGGGLLSPLARSQYAALAGLRWRVFVNGLRSKLGAFEMGARTVATLVYSMMGLGLGVVAALVAFSLASHGSWDYLFVILWPVCLIWQVVPIMMASFQEQFDLGSLLRFPVGFRSFFLLYVVFGLSDISTILGALCCVGIFAGVTLARPGMVAWAALILAVFAAFNILMVRAVFAWIDRWLSQRKTREIVGALFMLLALSMQLLNPAFRQQGHRGQPRMRQRHQIQQFLSQPWVQTVKEVQSWLPPGLAGVALQQASDQQTVPALESIAGMGLFVIVSGGVLGLRLRAEYRGESLGAAPARKKAAASAARAVPARERAVEREGELQLGIWGAIPAIMEKEVQSLLRTLPLLYAVGAPLVLVLVVSGGFMRGATRGYIPMLAFPLCVFFAQLGFRQLFSNSLGTEGPGIQLYFLSPTPMRTVLLAKNLLHSAVFVAAVVIAAVLATVRLGQPSGMVLAATAAFFAFVLPVNLALGNIFSLTMPYRVNPGRISRQRGSQASTLLSLLFQALEAGVGVAVFELCSMEEMLWLAIPIFLMLGAIATFLWLRILGNSDKIASEHKDQLIALLMKAE